MMHDMKHCQRPWWKRPPFWFIAIIGAMLLFWLLPNKQTDTPALTPYSTFLDQLDAGNIASVTMQGTEINGHYKHPLDSVSPNGTKVQQDTFSSRVPDLGDSTLISGLHNQHVVIDVSSPSTWASLLSHLPWPMLLFLGVAVIAGLFRLMRGDKVQAGSVTSALPAHGMMGLVSRLFAKREQTSTPTNVSDETKHH